MSASTSNKQKVTQVILLGYKRDLLPTTAMEIIFLDTVKIDYRGKICNLCYAGVSRNQAFLETGSQLFQGINF